MTNKTLKVELTLDEAEAILTAIGDVIGLGIISPQATDFDFSTLMMAMTKLTRADKTNTLYNRLANRATKDAELTNPAALEEMRKRTIELLYRDMEHLKEKLDKD